MRSFKQLLDIAQIYTKQFTSFPCNPFLLCTQLQISFKVRSQAVEDFAGTNPLISTPAILYKESGKVPSYIIYFDETSMYWRFYIFHEIAHYVLGHTSDSLQEEQEANLMACLLIAPKNKLPTYLKNAKDLSLFAEIPIAYAEEYWNYLHNKLIKPKMIFNIMREGGADIFLDYFMLIIQDYVCTLPGSYSREIFLFVLCYTNQYSC